MVARNETVYEPVPSLTFNTNPPTPFDYLQGRLYWDATDQTLAISQAGGTSPVTLQIGQEMQVLVWNDTGADFPNGAILHPVGSVAYRPSAALSQANTLANARARGIATMAIPKNTSGFVTTFGMVRGFDTQTPGWAEGDTLYLSDTVAGGLQNTPPTSGYNVVCGYVLRRHPEDGIIFFSPYPLPAFGDIAGGNYMQIDYEGGITYAGNAKRGLTLRPQLYAGRIGGVTKPTFVTYGANAGYSFPIYNNDDEEMFFREHIPGRWDGASDISAVFVFYLSGAEDAGDNFRFQLSWANKATASGVISNATQDVNFDQAVIAGRTAQFDWRSLRGADSPCGRRCSTGL
jgi:hypothetical protein